MESDIITQSAQNNAIEAAAMAIRTLDDPTRLSLPGWDSEDEFPPENLDSNEPNMERHQHLMQMLHLIACLQWLWRDRNDYFVSGNLTVYYSPRQKKSEFFRGPDFFVAKDCDPNPNRRSWVVWHEDGKYPNFILEILSESTAAMDRGEKKEIYQNIFRTPEYFLYEPETQILEGYRLQGGRYVAIPTNDRGLIWSEQLELYLGIWEGSVRFFDASGDRVLMPEEDALLAMQQLEDERQKFEAEKQRADRLAERLRALGVDED